MDEAQGSPARFPQIAWGVLHTKWVSKPKMVKPTKMESKHGHHQKRVPPFHQRNGDLFLVFFIASSGWHPEPRLGSKGNQKATTFWIMLIPSSERNVLTCFHTLTNCVSRCVSPTIVFVILYEVVRAMCQPCQGISKDVDPTAKPLMAARVNTLLGVMNP